ncbi:MAG: hypothetical protein V2B18_25820, partial [Pseudomonadota bacterium]
MSRVVWGGSVNPATKTAFIGEMSGDRFAYFMSHETSHVLSDQGNEAVTKIKANINQRHPDFIALKERVPLIQEFLRDEVAATLVGGWDNFRNVLKGPEEYDDANIKDARTASLGKGVEMYMAEVGVTSAQDTAYLKAIESGDMTTAQKMVDEAAKKWQAYDTFVSPRKKLFHGTRENFTVFDLDAEMSNIGPDSGVGFMFTERRTTAESVARRFARGEGAGGGRVVTAYLKIKNPMEFDGQEDWFDYVRGFASPEDVRVDIRDAGNDGVVVWNADVGRGVEKEATEHWWIAIDPTQIKSADPVTRDDKGNIIPLSERFREGPDIRYATGAAEVTMPTLADVQSIFKGQEVIQPGGENSPIYVKTRGGKYLTIETVNQINPNEVEFEYSHGEKYNPKTMQITGAYGDGTVRLVRDKAGKWTLRHEQVHFLEDAGILNSADIAFLRRHIKEQVKAGKIKTANKNDIGGSEDRANFIADALTKMPKGLVGRVIVRVREFIDRLVNAFGKRTAGGVVRDIESGKIFEGKATRPAEAYSAETTPTLAGVRERYAMQSPPVTKDPKALNNWLKDDTDAIIQTIISKFQRESGMTWTKSMLLSPEWWDHPQLSKIVKLFTRDRNEIYHETFNDLNATEQPFETYDTVSEVAKSLKNRGLTLFERYSGKVSPEYQRLQDILEEGDTTWKRDTGKPLDKQIKAFEDHIRKQGATADTIAVWKLYRQSYDKALDLQTQQMRDMIDQISEEAAFKGISPADYSELYTTLKGALVMMETWKGFYAPRLREQGEWKVQASRPAKEGKEFSREHARSELAARRIANRLKREGWDIYSVGKVEKLPEDIYQDVSAVATAKLIDSAVAKMQAGGESTLKFSEEVLRAVADEIRARGFRSHMLHRGESVVKGYIEDPIKRHILYSNQLSGGISKAKVAKQAMLELLGTKADGKQVGGIDAVKDPEAYKVATNYIREQLRNIDASDRIIGLAKSIATFKFLGFNLRSLAVNVTAMATTAPSSIHQYAMGGKGSMFGIMKELGIAGKDYGAFMAGRKLANTDEQDFLAEAKRKGWDDAQYTREALG